MSPGKIKKKKNNMMLLYICMKDTSLLDISLLVSG